MKTQALYDFDGTITTKDTTIILLFELVKLRPWLLFGLIWFLLRMIAASTSKCKQKFKNKAIGYLIKGLSDNHLNKALKNFRNRVKPLYRSTVLSYLNKNIQDGCAVLIITASPSFAISKCLSDLPVTVLGTEFEKERNLYTGHLKGKNCYGQEKVNRINKWAISNNIKLSIKFAWSDHISDFDMLRLSEKRFWIGGKKLKKLTMDLDPGATFINKNND